MNDRKLDRLFLRYREKKDLAALGRVFDLTARELLGIAAHLVRDPAQAEDLVQATFLAAIERAGHYDGSRSLVPWLVGILTREARLWNRRASRQVDVDRLDARTQPEPVEQAEQRELSEHVVDALTKLSEPYREVLLRSLRDGESPSEIARALERAPGTVRVQIHRGLELLRKELPLGLASGLVVVSLPTRGLAAVRAEVIAQASLAPAAVTAAAIGSMSAFVLGGIAMKKLAAVAAAVVCVAVAWIAWSARAEPKDEGGSREVARAELARETSAEARIEPIEAGAGSARAPLDAATDKAKAAAVPSAPGALRLQVRWQDGQPAAGVRIDVLSGPADAEGPADFALTCDASGRAEVASLAAGAWRVELDRTANGRSAVIEAGTTTELVIDLPDGIDVEGRVVDERGEPIAGAAVLLSDLHRALAFREAAQSDEHGAFRLRDVGGECQIGARASGHAPSTWVMVKDPVLKSGEVARCVIELARGGARLRGTVRDQRGTPIEKALVRIGGFQGNADSDLQYWSLPVDMGPDLSVRLPVRPLHVYTDALGRFTAEGVEQKKIPVSVHAAGRAPWNEEVDTATGEDATVDVVLVRGATIEGTVRHADGRPAARVAVVARARLPVLNRWTRTAVDGSYRLDDVAPGEVELHANHDRRAGALSVEAVVDVVSGESTRWDPNLPAALSLRGRALDEEGRALSGWDVRASAGFGRQVDLKTNADGTFVIEGCADEPYELELRAPGEDWIGMPSAQARDVRPGPGEIVLQVTSATRPSAWIIGKLVQQDGTPIGPSTIYADHRMGRRRETSPDAQGAFRLGPLPPGTITLGLASSGHAYHQLAERDLGARETLDVGTLVVEPAGSLRIHVHTAAGRAPEALAGEVFRLGSRGSGRSLAGGEGVLTSGSLEAGEYEVFLVAERCAATRMTITVPSGAEKSLEVELAPGVNCPLRITRRDGKLVGYASYTVVSAAGERVAVSRLLHEGAPGRLASVGLAPGTYTIEASGEDGLRARAAVVVTTADQALPPVELMLE